MEIGQDIMILLFVYRQRKNKRRWLLFIAWHLYDVLLHSDTIFCFSFEDPGVHRERIRHTWSENQICAHIWLISGLWRASNAYFIDGLYMCQNNIGRAYGGVARSNCYQWGWVLVLRLMVPKILTTSHKLQKPKKCASRLRTNLFVINLYHEEFYRVILQFRVYWGYKTPNFSSL